MSVDFADLLYRSLPGLYRDKDERGELRRFLEIMALPLAELEASVEQLNHDFFIEECREPFVGLLGDLVGVEVDPTSPERVQRAEVLDALEFYRTKGLGVPLQRFAESLSGFPAALVDFSQVVAQVPFLDSLNPVEVRRDQPVGEDAGTGQSYFRSDRALQPLFDAVTGRLISREALAGHEADYAGAEGRFDIEHRGVSLFRGVTPGYTAVAANLTDFSQPKTPGGAALALAVTQIAVDPALGRFLIADPALLSGNLRATYAALVPASIRTQAVNLTDPKPLTRLGRVDDSAPYSIDLRAPRSVTDNVGQKHFDNHGFFITPGRPIQNQRANVLPPATESGNFSFDDRPLALADAQGITLQLLDSWDGVPITRGRLEGHELEFCGTARGFTIRDAGISITGPDFPVPVRVRAADLSNFSSPKTATGAPLVLLPTDVAIDPELGRFKLDLAALGLRAEQIQVDYLLALSNRFTDATPFIISPSVPSFFAFTSDGATLPLRDRYDGTPISVALRLGRALADYHGGARGWTIRRNGSDVSSTLAAELKALDDPSTVVTAGRVAIDPDRARFKLPTGFLASNDHVTVDFSIEDPADRDRVFESVAQRLPRALPAGIVPVLIDTRRTPANPAKVI